MHGIIFTSFRHFVMSRYGPERAGELWAGEPRHLITQAYPDGDFVRLLGRVAEGVEAERDDLMRDFGRFAGERTFVMLYPSHYEEAGSPRDFLLSVEERIHRLVRATVPEASPPSLDVEPLGRDGVAIRYCSPRRLCPLLEGLILGTAAHYETDASVHQAECMRDGAEACLFEARFGEPL